MKTPKVEYKRWYNGHNKVISPRYKKAIWHYVVERCSKEQACIRAGLSVYSAKEVFYRSGLARKEMVRLMEEINKNVTAENMPLIQFYRDIINAAPGETWETHVLRRLRKATKGDPSPEDVLVHWEEKNSPVTVTHKLAAAKELSVLLGLREEKVKVSEGDDLMAKVQRRRQELSGGADGKTTEPV